MNEMIASTVSQSQAGMAQAFGWFDISEEDRDRVSALKPLVDAHVDRIVDDFHDRAGGFDEDLARTRGHQGARIRDEQKRHFRELVEAGLSEEYYRTRRDAGVFNERIGMSPSVYLGAYSYFIDRLGALVLDEAQDAGAALATFRSLQKIASCHKALTLDAFSTAREEAIEAREREMSELPVPVLKMREGLLLVPVVGTLDSHRARLLTGRMLDAIRDQGARAVVLDITGVAAVDSAVANHLIQTMAAARLMGAYSVLTGITAEVAQALVKVGVNGEALNPAGDLQHGIRNAEALLEA